MRFDPPKRQFPFFEDTPFRNRRPFLPHDVPQSAVFRRKSSSPSLVYCGVDDAPLLGLFHSNHARPMRLSCIVSVIRLVRDNYDEEESWNSPRPVVIFLYFCVISVIISKCMHGFSLDSEDQQNKCQLIRLVL